MLSFSILLIFFGIPFGFILRNNLTIQKITNSLFSYSVWVLLFFLGLGLGIDKNLMLNLSLIGFQALIICFFACLGSIFFAVLLASYYFKDSFANTAKNTENDKQSSMIQRLTVLKDTAIVLFFFVGGIIMGNYSKFDLIQFTALAGEITLYILLFLAGICVGFDLKAFRILQELKGKIILIPLFTIIGSFLFAPISLLFLSDLTVLDTLLVASGLGYYSLSSSLISQEINPMLGSVALMANILREVFTLIFTPILVQCFSRLSPIMLGAATANDCSLPIIAKYCSERYAILAIFSGVSLTFMVPVLLTILFYFV